MKKNVFQVVFEMETELLTSVIELVKKNSDEDDIQDLIKWKLQKLRDLGAIKNNSIKIIKKNIPEIIKMVEADIKEKGIEAATIIDEGIKNKMVNALSISSDPRLMAVWERYEKDTRDKIFRLNAKLLKNSEDMYIDIIETSVNKTLAGQSTLRDAIRETSLKWAKDRFKPEKDLAGRQWTTEGYTKMVIRSNLRQVTTDTQIERMDELGLDLVEISSHLGARPNCELYQGKVFSLSGKSDKYPAFDTTSYGEIDGLFGINCGHRMYPYIEGTEKTYKPFGEKENEKAYKESQEQRYLERRMRQLQRDLQFEKVMGDKRSIDTVKGKLSQTDEQLKRLITETGRKRRTDREEIYE